MSSTNKTTNYELSQFIGTDKPAWLGDYNSDMAKIDAQMKVNANGVASASGTATSASTNIGNLTNLTTTSKTNLVSAVNEVKSQPFLHPLQYFIVTLQPIVYLRVLREEISQQQ